MTLAYLLCVLAPTISFALPGGKAIAYCLTDDDHTPGMMHMHHPGAMGHGHVDGHHHAGMHSHEHASSDHSATIAAAKDDSGSSTATHDGQCCGLMCVTALPVVLSDFTQPSIVPPRMLFECTQRVVGKVPPGLYRPPIS